MVGSELTTQSRLRVLFKRHLLLTNVATSCAQIGTADVLQQHVSGDVAKNGWDWRRTCRMAAIGFVMAPSLHTFYKVLDSRRFTGNKRYRVLKKLAWDTSFIPVFSCTFITVGGIYEGKSLSAAFAEYQKKMWHIWKGFNFVDTVEHTQTLRSGCTDEYAGCGSLEVTKHILLLYVIISQFSLTRIENRIKDPLPSLKRESDLDNIDMYELVLLYADLYKLFTFGYEMNETLLIEDSNVTSTVYEHTINQNFLEPVDFILYSYSNGIRLLVLLLIFVFTLWTFSLTIYFSADFLIKNVPSVSDVWEKEKKDEVLNFYWNLLTEAVFEPLFDSQTLIMFSISLDRYLSLFDAYYPFVENALVLFSICVLPIICCFVMFSPAILQMVLPLESFIYCRLGLILIPPLLSFILLTVFLLSEKPKISYEPGFSISLYKDLPRVIYSVVVLDVLCKTLIFFELIDVNLNFIVTTGNDQGDYILHTGFSIATQATVCIYYLFPIYIPLVLAIGVKFFRKNVCPTHNTV